MPPHSKFLADSPSQGNSTYPCDREKGTTSAVPPVNLRLLPDRASGLRKKTKGTARAVSPVNLWLSSDRASGLGKRQKGQLALSPLSIYGFHWTAPAVWGKDKRDNLRRSSCQSTAFIGPRQRPGKKTKGTACAVPPVYGVIIKFR